MPETSQRSNLGRGLAALLGDSKALPGLDSRPAVSQVPVEHLHPNPRQPRQTFVDEATRELADSIRQNGVLQPILVRGHPEQADQFEIVAGERRWRAAQLAQLHEVPVVVRELTDSQSLELALVENLQREDLNPLEEAEAYRRLMEEFGNSQDDLAKVIGKSRSHVANTLRLLALPSEVKSMLSGGDLSAGHARALLATDDPEAAARKVVAGGLTVRQTEALAKRSPRPRRKPRPAAAKGAARDPDTVALERDLSVRLGLKVSIEFDGEQGRLAIYYDSLEQLDDVLRRLQGGPSLAF